MRPGRAGTGCGGTLTRDPGPGAPRRPEQVRCPDPAAGDTRCAAGSGPGDSSVGFGDGVLRAEGHAGSSGDALGCCGVRVSGQGGAGRSTAPDSTASRFICFADKEHRSKTAETLCSLFFR